MLLPVFIALLPARSSAAAANEVELVGAQTPWRVHLVSGPIILRGDKGELRWISGTHGRIQTESFDPASPGAAQERYSPLAPAGWVSAGFDDHHWPRYLPADLAEFLGGYGSNARRGGGWNLLTSINMRTRFGISDPAAVKDLTVTVKGIGGMIVYINGQEIGRSFMPEGQLHPMTLAQDYPREVYVSPEGKPLPQVRPNDKPDESWLDRYESRVRSLSVQVPREVLEKGTNVLAVDVRRAPAANTYDKSWDHAGVQEITLRSRSADGVIPWEQAMKGTHIWSVPAEQQIAVTVTERSVIRRGGREVAARGMQVRGATVNPFDQLQPLRVAIPRNGVGSAQVVVTDQSGLKDVAASIQDALRGPGGASLPAAAVEIRYAEQPKDLHYADTLRTEPLKGAVTIPIWLVVQVPAKQPPGWYTGRLGVQANGAQTSVPVQVLVTGYELPGSREFSADIAVIHSPKSVHLHYGVQPWSEEHWQLIEPSMKMLGQVGNKALDVPVILSNFPTASRAGQQPSRSKEPETWRQPIVRWVEGKSGLEPDFTILGRYLDLYVKHAGPPRTLTLGIWDPASAEEVADSYEGAQTESRQVNANPPQVEVWDPKTGKTRTHVAPTLLSSEAEAFWKPMIDGVRDVVKKRGWPEEMIMLGLGGDVRPGQQTLQRVKKWVPYARWDLLSHFSGDPGALHYKGRRDENDPRTQALKEGYFIGIGGIEVGVKRFPWAAFGRVFTASELEEQMQQKISYLILPTARWHYDPNSPPFLFRMLPQMWGQLGQLGLDFWMPRGEGPSIISFFNHVNNLVAPGPNGADPTVRFLMLRQGVQDFEVRMAVIRGYEKLPEEKRAPYRALLDELRRRNEWSASYLSQHHLSYDYPAYVAAVQEAAAELAGVKVEAKWEQPPASE